MIRRFWKQPKRKRGREKKRSPSFLAGGLEISRTHFDSLRRRRMDVGRQWKTFMVRHRVEKTKQTKKIVRKIPSGIRREAIIRPLFDFKR